MADDQTQPERFGADDEIERSDEDRMAERIGEELANAIDPLLDKLDALLTKMGAEDDESGVVPDAPDSVADRDDSFAREVKETGIDQQQIVLEEMAQNVEAIRIMLEEKTI